MPQPTPSDAHVNRPLTTVSVAFLQDQKEFIADRVFPNVPVTNQSDRYFLFEKGNWYRTEAKPRPPSTESAGSGFTIDSTPNYYANVQALHKDIDDQLRANQDAPLNLDAAATEFVTRGLVLRREKDWATKFFTTSVWTGSTTGGDITVGTQWDAAGSTPIEDIRAQLVSVKKKTGFRPNKLVMGEEVWTILQDHPDFLERIKYTQKGIVTKDLLASLLELDEVLVGGAIENTAEEGDTDALSFIFGKNALVVYANPRPSLLMPSGGYTFSWTGYLGAAPTGQRILRFRMQHLRSDRIEGEMAYDQKLVAAECGAFFSAPVS